MRWLVLTALVATVARAEEPGQVNLPLDAYTTLVQNAAKAPRPPPIGYAIGSATVQVSVNEALAAELSAAFAVEILDDQWVLVPVLPTGSSVAEAFVDDRPVQLVATPFGLAWGSRERGTHQLRLRYHVDAQHSGAGVLLAVPLPQASPMKLVATLPGAAADVAVIPASAVQVGASGEGTQVSATLPVTQSAAISWRRPAEETYALSRASYSGTLRGDAVAWSGELTVELLGTDSITLPLFPASVTLSNVQVDGREASILVQGGAFTTLVKGRGRHVVRVGFEVPVIRDAGPPQVKLAIPEVPVSRFELVLPGKKEVSTTPAASVVSQRRGDATVATVYVPLGREVQLSWNEAVPDAVREELRANAELYHAAHAEEGVLHVNAMIFYEVTRGETNVINLEVPENVEINSVTAAGGGVADWRRGRGARTRTDQLSVFLDRQVSGPFQFSVVYEQLLGNAAKPGERFTIPLLSAVGVHRQRGMVALLASKELTLKPVDEQGLSKVGENQLPAEVRQAITMTIAHTYKYTDAEPRLSAEASEPERKEGKFDAEVNTLISLSDVTLKGSATVEVNVKSGGIDQLVLALPAGVNFLDRAAPSLRSHKVTAGEGGQLIELQFTQEMDGQFRVHVTYERILADADNEVPVPTLRVEGAEVEQGRIAVEALTAVEVQPAAVEQLSSLDVNELPQQLILETTNPILLAYKYVHVDPPYKLSLKIARHKEIDVQSATIDQAHYRTLFTPDGLAVTTAQFTVRNSRKQFLKVALPEGSKVWSVFVAGQAEKPALESAAGKASGSSVLIKIINSTQGFPVDLIYATPISRLGPLGKISHQLPRPDMVVTQSRWDVFLPDRLTYGAPDANMDIIEQAVPVTREEIEEEVADAMSASERPQMVEPLRLSVPTAGIRYRFAKLYANQADEAAHFSIPYASGGGAWLGRLLAVFGTALLWLGLLLAYRRDPRVAPRWALGAAGGGLLIVLITVGYLGTGVGWALIPSGLVFLAVGGMAVVDLRANRPPLRPPPRPAVNG